MEKKKAVEYQYTHIRDLKHGMKNMNLLVIMLDIGTPNLTKDGHEVRTCKVGDKSGAVNFSVWDEPGQLLQSGDIVRITKGYSSFWKNCLTLYTGKGGDIIKVGEFTLLFSEQPNMSEPNPELANAQVGAPPNQPQVGNAPRQAQPLTNGAGTPAWTQNAPAGKATVAPSNKPAVSRPTDPRSKKR